MTLHQKIQTVYQCSLETKFRDLSGARESYGMWRVMTEHQRSVPAHLSDAMKQCVGYFKNVLVVGSFYSLPAELYRGCLSGFSGAMPADMGTQKRCELRITLLYISTNQKTPTIKTLIICTQCFCFILSALAYPYPQRILLTLCFRPLAWQHQSWISLASLSFSGWSTVSQRTV